VAVPDTATASATPRSCRSPAPGKAVRHDPDRPHDRTCFRVGTGLRSYSSPAPLGAETRSRASDRRRTAGLRRESGESQDRGPHGWSVLLLVIPATLPGARGRPQAWPSERPVGTSRITQAGAGLGVGPHGRIPMRARRGASFCPGAWASSIVRVGSTSTRSAQSGLLDWSARNGWSDDASGRAAAVRRLLTRATDRSAHRAWVTISLSGSGGVLARGQISDSVSRGS
jgi:hypothetical protein